MAKKEAVDATVSGDDQQVGFRALVMKQAIEYNLAGSAKTTQTKLSILLCKAARSGSIGRSQPFEKGTERSSDIRITTTPTKVDSALKAFTIVDWTSSRRDIKNKYNLVFKLRPDDKEISQRKAEAVWHRILEKTLSAKDLKKLQPDD